MQYFSFLVLSLSLSFTCIYIDVWTMTEQRDVG